MFFASFEIERLEDAEIEPVTLDEAKAFLAIREGSARYDSLILSLVKSARIRCESSFREGMSFLPTKWKMTGTLRAGFSGFGIGQRFSLPYGPVLSVESVSYDTGFGYQTVDPEGAYLTEAGKGGGIRLAAALSLPWGGSVAPRLAIDYTAGYGPSPASVPEPVKIAILMMTANFFEFRSTDQPMPKNVTYLLESVGL